MATKLDIAALMHKIDQELRANAIASGQMMLGEFLIKLDALPGDMLVIFKDGYSVGDEDSFRGYYEQMGLESQTARRSVESLRKCLRSRLGTNMEGYKGGLFRIDRTTLLWRHTYGSSAGAEMIVDVQDIDGVAVVLTKPDPED